MSARANAQVASVRASAYTIPTDSPEADGTFGWTSTTIVIVEVTGGGQTGIGYTYSSASIEKLVVGPLTDCILGNDAMDPPTSWRSMTRAVRNMGRDGLAATAISAVDAALWDLKAKLLDLPLALLLGRCRDVVPIYGSGGFTTYSDDQLRNQLADWIERDGCSWVKMKVGSDPERDPYRVSVAKQAIGDRTLFVDANGAYSVHQALAMAERFARDQDVRWFEEPVSSDDLTGLELSAAAPASSHGVGRRRVWFRSRLFPQDADGRRGRRAASRRDTLRRGNRLLAERPIFAKLTMSICPVTARPRCTSILPAPLPDFAISNGFTITFESNACCSTVRRFRATGRSGLTSSRPGFGLDFKRQDAERFKV